MTVIIISFYKDQQQHRNNDMLYQAQIEILSILSERHAICWLLSLAILVHNAKASYSTRNLFYFMISQSEGLWTYSSFTVLIKGVFTHFTGLFYSNIFLLSYVIIFSSTMIASHPFRFIHCHYDAIIIGIQTFKSMKQPVGKI